MLPAHACPSILISFTQVRNQSKHIAGGFKVATTIECSMGVNSFSSQNIHTDISQFLSYSSSCKILKKKRAQGQYVGPCDNARSVNKQKNKTSAQQTSNRSGQGGDCICFHLCGRNTAKFFQLAIIIYIIIYIISWEESICVQFKYHSSSV